MTPAAKRAFEREIWKQLLTEYDHLNNLRDDTVNKHIRNPGPVLSYGHIPREKSKTGETYVKYYLMISLDECIRKGWGSEAELLAFITNYYKKLTGHTLGYGTRRDLPGHFRYIDSQGRFLEILKVGGKVTWVPSETRRGTHQGGGTVGEMTILPKTEQQKKSQFILFGSMLYRLIYAMEYLLAQAGTPINSLIRKRSDRVFKPCPQDVEALTQLVDDISGTYKSTSSPSSASSSSSDTDTKTDTEHSDSSHPSSSSVSTARGGDTQEVEEIAITALAGMSPSHSTHGSDSESGSTEPEEHSVSATDDDEQQDQETPEPASKRQRQADKHTTAEDGSVITATALSRHQGLAPVDDDAPTDSSSSMPVPRLPSIVTLFGRSSSSSAPSSSSSNIAPQSLSLFARLPAPVEERRLLATTPSSSSSSSSTSSSAVAVGTSNLKRARDEYGVYARQHAELINELVDGYQQKTRLVEEESAHLRQEWKALTGDDWPGPESAAARFSPGSA